MNLVLKGFTRDLRQLADLMDRLFGSGPAPAKSNETPATGRRILKQLRQAKRRGGRRKGYKMSEATKRKLRASWKRRKAAIAGGA